MKRNHLAKDDLDWLPERYRLLRGAIVSGVWTGLFGLIGLALWSGGHVILFGKGFIALGAAGYWLGDRAAKGLVGSRLHKLARGQVDLKRLSNTDDGDLVHVRGTVRALSTVPALLTDEHGVYRRTRSSFEDIVVVDEAAVDFQLVDAEGNAIGIEVEGARWLTLDPKLEPVDEAALERVYSTGDVKGARTIARKHAALRAAGKARWLPTIKASEVLLRPGDLVEAVGYKSRRVDPTVVDRLAREAPMRATLRGGKELPLILSRVEPAEGRE